MKYSKEIQKVIKPITKNYLKNLSLAYSDSIALLKACNDLYGNIFPNNDWSNVSDEWEQKWADDTFSTQLNINPKDRELLNNLDGVIESMLPQLPYGADEDPQDPERPDLLELPYPVLVKFQDTTWWIRQKNFYKRNINRIKNQILSSDEAKIINSIKQNNFKTEFDMAINNITDRSKYPYNIGKINNYLIEYCRNNNLNIIFIGTGSHPYNGLGRYQRYGINPRIPNIKDNRVEQEENRGITYLSRLNTEPHDDLRRRKISSVEEADKFLQSLEYIVESDPEVLSTFNSRNFESHFYAPFNKPFFEYVNKIWGDLRVNDPAIMRYWYDEISVNLSWQEDEPPDRLFDEVYDVDLWLDKAGKYVWTDKINQKDFISTFTYTKTDFLKEHKEINKENLEWLKFSSKTLSPITYTCNIGINGAEFDLTNLDILFEDGVLDKSNVLLVIENNGFKNDDFITKTDSFTRRIIFNTRQLPLNRIRKINWGTTDLATITPPTYNYFLPILKVLLELSPYTMGITINSSLLSNKVIKNIVATHLINYDTKNFDPTPVDINLIQNFERNFNSAIYILRKSGFIEKKSNLVITEEGIKKIRTYIKNPDISPIVITHSNNRTKYLIGKNTYWSTSDQIKNNLTAGQIEDFKQLTKSEDDSKTVRNFIESFEELNKLITLSDENKKGNINSEYTNFSLAILRANNEE